MNLPSSVWVLLMVITAGVGIAKDRPSCWVMVGAILLLVLAKNTRGSYNEADWPDTANAEHDEDLSAAEQAALRKSIRTTRRGRNYARLAVVVTAIGGLLALAGM